MSIFDRILCSTWTSKWDVDAEVFEELRSTFPPYHTDFRDTAPPSIEEVNENYDPIVREGRWTVGLFDMWCPKAINAKHAVHIPCCSSFRLNPLKWRGRCLGRTFREFYWSGLYQARWARMVYAANLGKEYVLPVQGVGRHGYKSEIEALCWMYCLMGCVFSCGIGQEMRELAIRGIDGPGMHVLDMAPQTYAKAPGGQEALTKRLATLETMLSNPPKSFKKRPIVPKTGKVRKIITDAKLGAKVAYDGAVETFWGEDEEDEAESVSDDLGWRHLVAPSHQEMTRGTPQLRTQTMIAPKVVVEEQDDGSTEEPRPMQKAWTVAY